MTDARPRLTPLGVMVLALLREGDMHPYEMLRLLQQRHRDRILPITKGALYHTVSRLEQQSLIAEAGVDRAGNRPERTSYALLGAGRDAVVGWVRAELPSAERGGRFRVALVEAHNLPRDEALALLERRRAAVAAELDDYRDGLAKARERAVPEQFLIDSTHEVALREADLRWMDDMLERLGSLALPWGVEEHPHPAPIGAPREADQQ